MGLNKAGPFKPSYYRLVYICIHVVREDIILRISKDFFFFLHRNLSSFRENVFFEIEIILDLCDLFVSATKSELEISLGTYVQYLRN